MCPNRTLDIQSALTGNRRNNAALCRKKEVLVEIAIVMATAWVVLMCVFVVYPGYVRMRERMSPKYAAARRVRLAAKEQREEEKRQRAWGDETARLKKWAIEHPDDSIAEAFLETLPVVNLADEDSVDDIEAALRKRQGQDDDLQRRMQDRRRKDAEYLTWAMQHPDNPVALRHLNEVLTEARQNAAYGPKQAEAARTVAEIEAVLGLAESDQQ